MTDKLIDRAMSTLGNWRWRMNNLYYISDKEGKKVKFEMNWAQEALFDQMHYLNLMLKARQLGVTTFVQLFMLDACLFNSNVRAGTIAHTLDDATRIFADKVKFPYDNLPDELKSARTIIKSNQTELELNNNSAVRVGASLRSGTLQYLHISEYGKMCAKFPEKAKEVRTGALNTVQAGQIVFIESTAEGQEGHFYDLCESAKVKQRHESPLGKLDFKFFFFPWWKSPEYELHDDIQIPKEFADYFKKLEENSGIYLTTPKKNWYVKKAEVQLSEMKREYPSTPEEAFEASIEGAYYAEQMAKADYEKRIGVFEFDPRYPVNSVSDIGMDDVNSVWLFQVLPGIVRFIGYFEESGSGMDGMIKELEKRKLEHGYKYGTHYMPHDIRVREWTRGGMTRIEIMLDECRKKNIGTVEKVHQALIEDQIQATRRMLGKCQFDEASTSQGLKCLRAFRKDWDEHLGVWKDKPRHDWASHGASAIAGLGLIYTELKPEPRMLAVDTPTGLKYFKPILPKQDTFDELHEMDAIDVRRERI